MSVIEKRWFAFAISSSIHVTRMQLLTELSMVSASRSNDFRHPFGLTMDMSLYMSTDAPINTLLPLVLWTHHVQVDRRVTTLSIILWSRYRIL